METPLVSEDGGDDACVYATSQIDVVSIESDAAGLLVVVPPVSDDAPIENEVAAPPNQTEPNVQIEVTDEIESDAANSDSEAKYLEVTSVEDATPSESAHIGADATNTAGGTMTVGEPIRLDPITITTNVEQPKMPVAGWLKKMGAKGLIKTWKLRWFVLDVQQHVMFYYRTPVSRVALGHISLINALMWLNKLEQASSVNHAYCTISTENRDYQLMAENEGVLQRWLDVIQATRDDGEKVADADGTWTVLPKFRHPDNCEIVGSYEGGTHVHDGQSSSDEESHVDLDQGHRNSGMDTDESPSKPHQQRLRTLSKFLRRKSRGGGSPVGSPASLQARTDSTLISTRYSTGSNLDTAMMQDFQNELKRTKAKLRETELILAQEVETSRDLNDTVAHLRQVIEASKLGAVIPVDKQDQTSYQIECLRRQNQFMNVELLKMKAVIKSDSAETAKQKEAYDLMNATQIELLGVIARSDDVAEIKQRATELMQGTLFNSQARSPIRRGSVKPVNSPTKSSYYDQWGFRISHDLSAAFHSLKDQRVAMEKQLMGRWEAYLSHRAVPEALPPKECPELKQLVRDGIPNNLRSQMWSEFVHMHSKTAKKFHGAAYYKRILDHKNGKSSMATNQIELDLMRTFPTHRDFRDLNSPKIEALRRVLVAFSWHNPSVGYCQGLNMIAAMALLFLEEEVAFWALIVIVEHIMPEKYFTKQMEGSQADQRVFRELLRDRCSKISIHLDKYEVDLSLISFNWMLVLFVDSVPPATAIRIWDSLLYEGSKIIFRVCLSIFISHQQEILKIHDRQELFEYIRSIPRQLFDTAALFRTAFGPLGGLAGFSNQSVSEKRVRKLEEIQKEMAELEERRRRYSNASKASNDDQSGNQVELTGTTFSEEEI